MSGYWVDGGQATASERQRRAAESLEERERRLLQLRANQHEKLAAESLEGRKHRLQRNNERETQTTTA